MKVLIIGAGATYSEALNLGIAESLCPPLMKNLARKLWEELYLYNPHPFLDKYLEWLGYEVKNQDGRQLFYKLEQERRVSIERFFEFCWKHRDKSWSLSDNPLVRRPGSIAAMKNGNGHELPKDFIRGFRMTSSNSTSITLQNEAVDFWNNMLNYGFGQPLQTMMIQCFYENGVGWKKLPLSQQIIETLETGDLVINLNYDTVFEIAINQTDKTCCYCPDTDRTSILVCKPHGSLNMYMNLSEKRFLFGKPEFLAAPPPPASGYYTFIGIIPPRLNKSYEQNPASKMMIDSVRHHVPSKIIFWGVGLIESDVDLANLYKSWVSAGSPVVEVINPDKTACQKIEKVLNQPANHYHSVDEWISEVIV